MSDHDWVDLGNGRQVYRKVAQRRPDKRSSIPCPSIIGTFRDPVKSMADGKYYTDAAGLRRSYRAANNPHGVDFIEIGDADITKFTPPKRDRKADRAAIERAIADVDAGRVPDVLTKAPV